MAAMAAPWRYGVAGFEPSAIRIAKNGGFSMAVHGGRLSYGGGVFDGGNGGQTAIFFVANGLGLKDPTRPDPTSCSKQ